MRTLSAGLTSAIQNEAGIKPSMRATVYKSRQFFAASDIEDTYEASFAQASGIQEAPISQDMTYCEEMDKLITVYAHANVIKLQAEGIAEFTPTLAGNPISTTTHCRPSVITTSGSAGYIYFYSSGSACFAEFDTEQAVAGTATCTSGSGSITDVGLCAIHAVDVDDIMILSIDEGGVKVTHAYYDGGWLTNEWPRRFMYPTHIYNNDDDILLNFSAAVKRDMGGGNYERIVYLSMPDGSVKGVALVSDGSWSDVFEAVPADLSRFLISNATVSPNDYIHLVGQFKRVDVVPRDEDDSYSDVEEPTYFNSTVVMCLDLWSREGRAFSLDRFTLFAAEDTAAGGAESAFRYQLAVKDDTINRIFYSDANRILEDDAIVSTSGSAAESLSIPTGDITSLSGSPNTSWTLKLKNGDEAYSNEELIAQGNKIDIEFGTSGSFAYLDECIIADIDSEYADGERNLVIRAMSNTLWRTGVMTHPFYMEFQSKQSVVIDDVSDTDQWGYLYDVSEDVTVPVTFMTDFWNERNLSPDTHEDATSTEYDSLDFLEVGLSEYPEISSLPISVKLYGWSRAGQGTVSDPTESGFPNGEGSESAWNDEFTAKITVEHSDETEEEISVDDLSSTYKNPEQTWYLTRSGDYPVIHSAGSGAGLEVGDKIKHVTFIPTSGSVGDHTTYYVERMEIPEVTMYVPGAIGDKWDDVDEVVKEAWEFPTSWDFEDGAQGWIEAPDKKACPSQALGNNASVEASGGRLKIWATIGWDANSWRYYPEDTVIAKTGATFTATGANIGFGGLNIVYTDGQRDEGWPTATVAGANNNKEVDYFCGGTLIHISQGTWYMESASITGFTVPDSTPAVEDAGKNLLRIGVPTIYLSQRPFRAFNFQASATFYVDGTGAYGGVVGLASDNKNYIVARASETTVELVKVRDGVETELASTSITTANAKRILFEHRDGMFRVWVNDDYIDDPTWSKTPDLSYEWTESDGQLCMSDDIIHVGLYGFRDAPKLRICSFNANNTEYLGVLPLGGDDYDDFPSSGTIMIDGTLYSYTGKIALPDPICGPYQARATTKDWDYTADGIDYDGNAVEFTRFEWLDQSTYYNKWNGKIMASDNGYAWLMGKTDFKPWIRTIGETVYLKNRGRFFGTDVKGNNVGWNQKMWITGGLSGVTPASEDEQSYSHPEGKFAYLSTSSQVTIFGFTASNGYEDMTVEDMLDKVCQIAGGEARFPGDVTYDSKTLTSSEWEVA